jgi:hypothetical protein
VVERWTPAFAGVTGGAAADWHFEEKVTLPFSKMLIYCLMTNQGERGRYPFLHPAPVKNPAVAPAAASGAVG